MGRGVPAYMIANLEFWAGARLLSVDRYTGVRPLAGVREGTLVWIVNEASDDELEHWLRNEYREICARWYAERPYPELMED